MSDYLESTWAYKLARLVGTAIAWALLACLIGIIAYMLVWLADPHNLLRTRLALGHWMQSSGFGGVAVVVAAIMTLRGTHAGFTHDFELERCRDALTQWNEDRRSLQDLIHRPPPLGSAERTSMLRRVTSLSRLLDSTAQTCYQDAWLSAIMEDIGMFEEEVRTKR